MRLPFLILTPACVLLGIATAVASAGRIDIIQAILVLIGALSAHISVNAFNEYADFKTGLDAHTHRTPFSGGSGTLPQMPDLAPAVLIIAQLTLAVSALLGVYFASQVGAGLLPLGIIGLFVIVAYTPWITHWPLFCLIAPGLGFGPLMVMGTHFVLTGQYSWTAFIASLIPFFLVNDLLLLNQFPDVEADRSHGRKHVPIVLGLRRSSSIYGLFLGLAYLTLLAGVYGNYLPKACLLGLATLVIAVPLFIGVRRQAENIEKLIPYLGLNVILNLSTPVLVAAGLFLGR